MFLPEFSMPLFIARRRDGRTLLFDNAIWSKRSARPGDGQRGRGSNGNPGADVEIVSIVTPPPCLVVPLEHSQKTCAQLHAQTSPLYPSAGLCGKPPFALISVARINLSLPVPAVWSYDILWLSH